MMMATKPLNITNVRQETYYKICNLINYLKEVEVNNVFLKLENIEEIFEELGSCIERRYIKHYTYMIPEYQKSIITIDGKTIEIPVILIFNPNDEIYKSDKAYKYTDEWFNFLVEVKDKYEKVMGGKH